jgi:hypothetical protein
VTDPQWIDVATPAVALRALSWGPEGAPIALCLHGFPDHQGRDHVCADQRGVPSVPSIAAFARLAAKLPRQLLHSWYIMYFQLPWLPDRSTSWVVPKLWRDWSPGYRADEHLRHVDAAIGEPRRAALGY